MAKYTRELLAEAAAQSTSVTGVLRLLGLRIAGGTHYHISKRMRAFGIDTSHFTGSAHNRGKASGRRVPPERRLVVLPPGTTRMPGDRLLRALLAIGRPERCGECGLPAIWNGKPLRLQVDHINGDFLDNRQENPQLLCPNCHSQTPTFGKRKREQLDSVNIAGVAEWQTRGS